MATRGGLPEVDTFLETVVPRDHRLAGLPAERPVDHQFR
jgi:hypothetical protein